MTFRNRQKAIPVSLINKSGSAEIDDKAPIVYLRDRLGEDTSNNFMGTIGEDMRKVLTSMLDPAIITINDNQGFTNPLNSFKVEDGRSNYVRFELGGVPTTIYFNNAKTPEQMVDELEKGILKGIKKLNERRGRQTLATQMTFEDWKTSTTGDDAANPSGDQTLAGYLDWLKNNQQ